MTFHVVTAEESLSPQCEAICITDEGGKRRLSATDRRCKALATDRVGPHAVCWTHKQAAGNVHRTIPLRWAR